MRWQPALGAWWTEPATHFRVWAPAAQTISVVVESGTAGPREFPLRPAADGYFEGASSEVRPGDWYRYRIDGKQIYPDPASRFQPQGVHGPSQVIDSSRFLWTDARWTGIALEKLVIYELQVGTFTPEGTFAAAMRKLPDLRDLGITAVELMPVADFAGSRNWGYDGVNLFAPARCYGQPDDLRHFIDAAHELGLAVHLDVVYNHFGPDGAYAGVFSPYYFSSRHQSPWGAGINFDEPQSAAVRHFFIESALYWIHEYHVDGLRLDATHAMVDDSPRHFLAELSAAVRDSLSESQRRVAVIAEDVRNLAHMVKPEAENGWGVDALWSDDFHHQMRRCLAGDSDGYFQDYDGTVRAIAQTARQGWYYTGQRAPFFGGPRGTDPQGISPSRFVFFLQNHDQVGNRAFGDRLHHEIELAAFRAATTLLLLLPEIPLLFMGQEWAATAPFQYFTDHVPELGKLVTEGRRNEFRRFAAFADPKLRDQIPDPQDSKTFEASHLNWAERTQEPHASTLRFYRRLLEFRRSDPALRDHSQSGFQIQPWRESGLLLLRQAPASSPVVAAIRLRGGGMLGLGNEAGLAESPPGGWELLFTTEDAPFAPDPKPIRVDQRATEIEFVRPGAAVFRTAPAVTGRPA